MTPGYKVLQAFKERKYHVVSYDDDPDYERSDDSEIAGIIEQEGCVVELLSALTHALSLVDEDHICPNDSYVGLSSQDVQKLLASKKLLKELCG